MACYRIKLRLCGENWNNMKPKAILTIDLEFWYNGDFFKKHFSQDAILRHSDRIKEEVAPLLKLLTKYNIKATFFVLGQLAEKYPEVIKLIADLGHEIASHGYSHTSLNDLSPITFEAEIQKTDKILTDILNKKILGYRAPAFSVNHKTKWALPILKDNGYLYDSSIFPMRTGYYGINLTPFNPYRPSWGKINEIDAQNNFLEIPQTVFNSGPIKIPIAGGIFFRTLPINLYIALLQATAKQRIPVLFFHPHELQPFIPDIKTSKFRKKLKYFGVEKSWGKFEQLLQEFEFGSIQDSTLLKEVKR